MRITLTLFALAAGLALFGSNADAQPRAQRDFCTTAGASATLVLVDRTSPYSRTGEDNRGLRIASGVDALLPSLDTGDRVTLVTIERHRQRSMVAFNECYPGCNRGQASGIPWLRNCSQVTMDRERRNFRQRLYAAVIPLLENASEQPASDITGTISQATGQHAYRRVYVFSDMLENSQVLPWGTFATRPAQQNYAAAQRSGFLPSLRNARVQVIGYGLSHSSDQRALTDAEDRNIREFWQLYFSNAGATVSYSAAMTPQP